MDILFETTANGSSATNTTTTAAAPDLGEKVNLMDVMLTVAVAVIMIGVGIAIDRDLFKMIATTKKMLIASGIVMFCQNLMLPAVGFGLAKLFIPANDPFVAFGFIVTASVPGGAISNFANYLGEGIVELSVFCSCCSNVLSFGFSPLWTYVYAGVGLGLGTSQVDFVSLTIGFVALVVPLVIGVILNKVWPQHKEIFLRIVGVITALASIGVVIIVVGGFGAGGVNKSVLKDADWRVWIPASCVLAPIACGVSYAAARFGGYSPAIARTCTLETLCQNVGITYAAIELSLRHNAEHRSKAFAFAVIYSLMQYVWAVLLILIFRWHHRYNKEHDIPDMEEEFEKMILLSRAGEGSTLKDVGVVAEDSSSFPAGGGGGGGEEDNNDHSGIVVGGMINRSTNPIVDDNNERSPLLAAA